MAPADPEPHAVEVHLDRLLRERGMTLTELSERVGVTIVNLSILKNGHAKAIRFTTLTRLCQALDCQPADLLSCRVSAGEFNVNDRAGGHTSGRPAAEFTQS
jgi:putative transcriptional regulator